MSLSDIMSATDQAAWQAAALVIFSGVFIAVAIHTWRRPTAEMSSAARLPIDDVDGRTGTRSERSEKGVVE